MTQILWVAATQILEIAPTQTLWVAMTQKRFGSPKTFGHNLNHSDPNIFLLYCTVCCGITIALP